MTDFASYKGDDKTPIVYVKVVKRDELPEEVQTQIADMEAVYSISNADGQVLALTDDRTKAFALARMNDLSPVSVH